MKKELNTKYQRAKHRVRRIKGFYTHLTVYIMVNLAITLIRIVKDIRRGDGLFEAILDGDNYGLLTFWGVFVVIHGIIVFTLPKFFGYEWEARKIEQFMKEDEANRMK